MATTTSDTVERIALVPAIGIGSASGTVDDVQQNAVVPAPNLQVEFDIRHPVTGALLGAREEFPSVLAVQRALGKALLSRDLQPVAICSAAAAFECVVGPRRVQHVIVVEQVRPIAPAHLVEVQAKLI